MRIGDRLHDREPEPNGIGLAHRKLSRWKSTRCGSPIVRAGASATTLSPISRRCGSVRGWVRERGLGERELKRDLAAQLNVPSPSGIHRLLPRDEAGDVGLGDEPVSDADTRVGGLHRRRLMDVYPGAREHLVGQLAGGGRVGEALEPVIA